LSIYIYFYFYTQQQFDSHFLANTLVGYNYYGLLLTGSVDTCISNRLTGRIIVVSKSRGGDVPIELFEHLLPVEKNCGQNSNYFVFLLAAHTFQL